MNYKVFHIEQDNIEKFINGDVAAFEKIFRVYSQYLLDFANSYVRDTEVAKDIVQEIFIKLWKNRERIDIDLNFKSYLFNSVRNKAIDHIKIKTLRREKDEYIELLYYPFLTPEDDLNEKEIDEAINQAMQQLPPRCRQIFEMKRFNGMTYSEISKELNISINTIETQISRALKSLRKTLSSFLSIINIYSF